MRKVLTVSGLIFFILKLSERLLNDFMPAINSSESLAYKAGFVVGLFIVVMAVIGLALHAYQLFGSPKKVKTSEV